jgi:cell fate regulator YaaT (PSP1 superfamily)
MSFVNVVGVQFRRAGKIYDFAPGALTLRVGDQVVVDTERGATLAKVVRVTTQTTQTSDPAAVKPVLRVANERDLDERGPFTEEQVMNIARSRVEAAKLDMRIMKAELQMSGNKVTVYFSAPGRVDFRDLVKDLAGALRARVELKQVGARDEAKLVGGVGICGREYCCSSFLRDFVPVSIKMAKNQNLALNPNKVSGGCGRLLCCLTYENDAYVDLRRKLPPLKSRVRIKPDGDSGNVIKTDILNQLVVFETADGRSISAKVSDIEMVDRGQQPAKDQLESEADVWAEDIDLNLLMGEGEPKSQKPQQSHQGQKSQKPPFDRQKHGGGSQQSQQRHGQNQRSGGGPRPGGDQRPGREHQNRGPQQGGGGRPPGDKPKKPQ